MCEVLAFVRIHECPPSSLLSCLGFADYLAMFFVCSPLCIEFIANYRFGMCGVRDGLDEVVTPFVRCTGIKFHNYKHIILTLNELRI